MRVGNQGDLEFHSGPAETKTTSTHDMALNAGRRLLAHRALPQATRKTARTLSAPLCQRRLQSNGNVAGRPQTQPIPQEVMKDSTKARLDVRTSTHSQDLSYANDTRDV